MGIVAPSPPPGAQSHDTALESRQPQPFSLDLGRSLRMRRGLAIAVGLCTLALLIAVGLTRKPLYEADSLIYVQPVTTRVVTDPTGGSYDAGRYDSYIQQQLLTLVRPDILRFAIDRLSPSARATLAPDSQVAVLQIVANLKVEHTPGSYQIEVRMRGSDAAAVTQIVNAITDAYLTKGQQDVLALSNQQLQALVQERARIQEELDKDRREQAGLSTALGVADTAGDNGNPFDVQLAELRSQLATARSAHAVAEAQLASVSDTQSDNMLESSADSVARPDAELTALKSSLGARRGILIAQMNGLTPENPLYKQNQQELTKLNQTIESMTAQVGRKSGQGLKSRLKLEAERTGGIEARLAADLARQTGVATSDTTKLQRAADLAASIKRLQARFSEIDNTANTISLGQNAEGLAHLSLAAAQPSSPLPSRKLGILVLALPIAFLFASLAAILRQKLDPHVYIGQDVERTLGFFPMAVLPESSEVSYKVAEEFLFRLVAGIDQAHRTGNAGTFVFTAGSEETSVDDLVNSVALEIERLGYKSITLSAAEALSPIKSSPDNGEAPEEWKAGTEMVRSRAATSLETRNESPVDEIFERIKRKVDFLFIKALPIRSSSEAEFVARLSDITVLVAQSGETTRTELLSCLSLMQRLKVRGIAAIVVDLQMANADQDFIDSIHFTETHGSSDRTVMATDNALAKRR